MEEGEKFVSLFPTISFHISLSGSVLVRCKMGKLNIAHHKSYHPYRRDNIEKGRRDEEEARQKEAQEEGRMQLAVIQSSRLLTNISNAIHQDSEARIVLLRDRAGVSDKPKKKKMREKDLDKVI